MSVVTIAGTGSPARARTRTQNDAAEAEVTRTYRHLVGIAATPGYPAIEDASVRGYRARLSDTQIGLAVREFLSWSLAPVTDAAAVGEGAISVPMIHRYLTNR